MWTLAPLSLPARLTGILLPLLLTWGGDALAQTQTAAPPPSAGELVGGGQFLQMLLGLTLVLGVMALAAWALRRLSGGRGFSQGTMKLIDALPVGTRERIVVVEVGEQWLVLGITASQITPLHTLPRQSLPPEAGQSFQARLRQFMEKKHDR